jgi:NitT/TauT family transport system ATP-binding protein
MLHINNFNFRHPLSSSDLFRSFCLTLSDEVTSIVARNGAGKSTLLGEINQQFIHHKKSKNIGIHFEPHTRIRYITQNPDDSLLPWYSSIKNLEVIAKLQKIRVDTDSFTNELQGYGIDPSQLVGSFSGGQKQLINLLISFYLQPHLLLMDEPFGALDLQNSLVIKSRFRSWQRQFGACVVLISHSMQDILELSDRVVILGGRPVQVLRELDKNQIDEAGVTIITQHLQQP